MRLSDLTPEQRDSLSTEEIKQITSELSCEERLHCSVPITPIMKLDMYLTNKSCTRELPQVNLEVLNPDQMRHRILFQLNESTVQRARIVGRSLFDPGILNVEDLVNIFELDASVKWQVHDIYRIGEGV